MYNIMYQESKNTFYYMNRFYKIKEELKNDKTRYNKRIKRKI